MCPGSGEAGCQNQDGCNEGFGFSARYSSVLPYCGVYFPSMQALEECAASTVGKEVLAHAVKISSGGPPIFLVAEEETFTFAKQ
jgi:hypothetical protein